jgi:hypothetical protein
MPEFRCEGIRKSPINPTFKLPVRIVREHQSEPLLRPKVFRPVVCETKLTARKNGTAYIAAVVASSVCQRRPVDRVDEHPPLCSLVRSVGGRPEHADTGVSGVCHRLKEPVGDADLAHLHDRFRLLGGSVRRRPLGLPIRGTWHAKVDNNCTLGSRCPVGSTHRFAARTAPAYRNHAAQVIREGDLTLSRHGGVSGAGELA